MTSSPSPRHGGLVGLVAVLALSASLAACGSSTAPPAPSASRRTLGSPAPDFSLVDQFGRPESLSDLRGNVVLLTFVDSHCTTLCPLTAELLWKARSSLGPDRGDVRLIAVDANPRSTSVASVRRWSERHGMLHRWLFLTGSVERLRQVWHEYGIEVQMVHGDVAHTAAVFVIDASGHTRTIFPVANQLGIDAESEALATTVQRVIAGPS
jgi:cytochrome oxidase Cu insertion factor (SCO1/SenC/PrrC family)